MARIPDAEIERLRQEISLERLVESSGVVLEKRGNDLVGRCPFHEDDTPSFVVTPAKNLFHCFGCQAGGGPIDWVMKRQGMSFRHAVEWLRADAPGGAPLADGPEVSSVRRTGRTARLPSPVRLDTDDQALLAQVIDYYHETLKQSPEALSYLQARGLDGTLIERFRLGYANRTLGLRLPEKSRKAGAEIRGRLEKIGIYRESGHEHFNGSLVVPVLDERGRVQEVYGRKIRNDLRPGTPRHLYLPGPHRGVWNIEGVAGSKGEVILAESLIDAMTFWSAGYRNVTAAYGAGGLIDDHLSALRRYGVERVLIAFDRDEAGERGASAAAERLMDAGLACFRIVFPRGLDANAYALKVTPAARALGVLIRKAQWLGNGSLPGSALGGRAPAITSARDAVDTPIAPSAPTLPDNTDDLLEAMALTPLPEPTIAAAVPPTGAADPVESRSENELVMLLGDRRYRVRGWKKPLNPESMKVNLLVQRVLRPAQDDRHADACGDDGRFHVDTLDLYGAKARASFAKQAGIELGESEDVLKHDLGRILLKLEALQDAELSNVLVKDEPPVLSDGEREAALAFLQAPDLIARIRADFAACGIVGEEVNALTGYLACVSRLLDRPLAVIIQSSSAAGKSAMMDAVLNLMPSQAQVRYSAMTGQSLFYMGETNLKHRILAIAEEEGATSAAYALKLLQSDGSVTIASTGKDAATGLLVTHEYRVEGPVMLFLTTTAIDIDEELLNRCLVLSVNESREQTRAIHEAQRRRQTLAGLLAGEEAKAVLALHRNAQGLLEAVKVVNPFADGLTFLDDKTRTRRDHMKYLTLIQAIALLHQHQRPIRDVQHGHHIVRYIEVEPSDIQLANQLASEVLGRTLDELPPQTRRLLHIVSAWAEEECTRLAIRRADLRFTRRQVRALTGWGDTQAKVHLARLASLEYLLIHRVKAGQGYEYELLYAGEGESGERFLMGLSTPAHAYDERRSGAAALRSVHGREPDGAGSAGGHRVAEMDEPRISAVPAVPIPQAMPLPLSAAEEMEPSYPHPEAG